MKKCVLLIILSIIFLIPINSYGANFTITEYDIEMNVNKDNTFDINEYIMADFLVPQHGIYRNLPLRNEIVRTDGTKSKNRAEVTDVYTSEICTVTNSSKYKTLKIGDANKTVTGEHPYGIKYKYNIGKDPLKDKDELYFNLIGSEWETTVSNVNFKITMPETFDASKVGFSVGRVGTSNSAGVEYNVEDKVIQGSYAGAIGPGEALTVRVDLPEGYFVGAKSTASTWDFFNIIVIIIGVVFVIIADRLWAKFGKDAEVVETVEFYPPEGYNSAEIGYMYSGDENKNNIITSLLLYLASKGYIKIEEESGTGLFASKKSFAMHKIKEYDGDNEIERMFFEALFEDGRETTLQSDLVDKFYVTVGKIRRKLKDTKYKIFEKSASGKVKWIIMMSVLLLILITIKPIVDYYDVSIILIEAVLFPAVGILMIVTGLMGRTKLPKAYGVFLGITFGGIPWCEMVLPALLDDTFNMVTYITGFICMSVLVFFASVMPKRTDYGGKMLGRIKGFKRFIETAYTDEIDANGGISKEQKIQELMEEDPEYFYNILPYAYALGLEKEWEKQFESIAVDPPNWYYGSNRFDLVHLNNFMDSVQNSMTTSYSSSGGYSGGGFSGGGSGRWRWRLMVKINRVVFYHSIFASTV